MQVNNLSLEEKIAQLFVVGYRNHEHAVSCVRKGVGGVWPCGLSGDDHHTFRQTIHELQNEAEIPLFICCDFELGVGQIISDGSCTEFPSLMAFGAIPKTEAKELAFQAGQIIAQEAAYLGVNTCPSPVFDVNTVPENPICNVRSIGEDPERVTDIAMQYALGMMSMGKLLPQAKHFPGEGMHRMDPHMGLEEMQVSREEMEEIHLRPFVAAARGGIPMMMTNHSIYPPYDVEYPATLSRKIITGLLREKNGFEGLVITDAMEMAGVRDRYSEREALILAINAGNDLILGSPNVQQGLEWVLEAVRNGEIPPETIDTAVSRILSYKEQLGILKPDFNRPEPKMPLEQRQALNREIARKSITLARDRNSTLPLRLAGDAKVLCLEPEHPRHTLEWGLQIRIHGLKGSVERYCNTCDLALFGAEPDEKDIHSILTKAEQADIILVSTFFRSKAGQVGLLTEAQVQLLKRVNATKANVVYVVSNPYVIAELPFAETILVTYGTNTSSVDIATDVIVGKLAGTGTLPVTIPDSIDFTSVQILSHD